MSPESKATIEQLAQRITEADGAFGLLISPVAAGALMEILGDLESAQADAARYRWLREQSWFDGPLCVLRDPKKVLTTGAGLGADCPSLGRLDEAIDAALRSA